MKEEFKSINQKTICAANKVAERMLKELKNTKTDYQQSRELYFACLEFFSILYDKEIDSKTAIEIFVRTKQLLMDKYLKLEKDSPSINIFWNTIITSNADGNECDVDEFLKNLRIKFEEKADIVLKLTSIAEKMYPKCNQIKLQTYKFDFIKFQKQLSIEFSGRITKEQINKMLEYIKNEQFEKFALRMKCYLEQHHLEYSNFEEKLTEINQEIINSTDARWINKYDKYYLDVKYYDNYFLTLWNYENWINEDISESKMCVIKYQDRKLNIISQVNRGIYDDYNNDVSYKYFYTQKNLTADKETTVNEEIIPEFIFQRKLFELLQKLDQIETVEEVKEIMKNQK